VAGERCVIYVRVSTGRQATDGRGLDAQAMVCQTAAEARGYLILGVVQDVMSGAAWQRPGVEALLEQAERREFDVLLADVLDRLGRGTAYHMLAGAFEAVGVRVEFAEQSFSNDDTGIFMRDVTAAVGAKERADILRRTMGGKRKRLADGGRMPGGRPAFGYRWDGKKKWSLAPDDETSLFVQRIFAWAAEGVSTTEIARRLTEAEVPTPTARPAWRYSVIRCLLRNPVYKGENRANRYEMVDAKVPNPRAKKHRYPRLRPEEEHLLLPPVPALVPADLWEAAQAGYRPRGPVRTPEATTLRGRVQCGQCTGRMGINRGRTGRVLYRCCRCQPRHSVLGEVVDAAAWDAARALILRPERIRAEVDRQRAIEHTPLPEQALRRKLADVNRFAANNAIALSRLDPDAQTPLLAEAKRLAALKRELQEAHRQLSAEHDTWAAAEQRLLTLLDWCALVAERLDMLSADERPLVYDTLDLHVRVWPIPGRITKGHGSRVVVEAAPLTHAGAISQASSLTSVTA